MACITALFFFSRESRPSVLLKRSIDTIRKETGFDDLDYDSTDKLPSIKVFTRTMLIRPTYLFFTEPIVCTVSIMSATVFASIYLQTAGLTVPYQELGLSERETSTVYTTWIIGLVLTVPIRVLDWHILSGKLRRQKPICPEDKLTGFYIAAPVLALALWWFAWTVPPRASSILPEAIGTVF